MRLVHPANQKVDHLEIAGVMINRALFQRHSEKHSFTVEGRVVEEGRPKGEIGKNLAVISVALEHPHMVNANTLSELFERFGFGFVDELQKWFGEEAQIVAEALNHLLVCEEELKVSPIAIQVGQMTQETMPKENVPLSQHFSRMLHDTDGPIPRAMPSRFDRDRIV